jgi:heat shock protein HtpX
MNHLKTYILLAAMTALFGAVGYLVGGTGGMVIALLVAGAMNLFAYWNADKMVLRHFRAQEIQRGHPDARVRAYVEDTLMLAERAGLPPPKVYIIDNPQPNAGTRKTLRSRPRRGCLACSRVKKFAASWRTSSRT